MAECERPQRNRQQKNDKENISDDKLLEERLEILKEFFNEQNIKNNSNELLESSSSITNQNQDVVLEENQDVILEENPNVILEENQNVILEENQDVVLKENQDLILEEHQQENTVENITNDVDLNVPITINTEDQINSVTEQVETNESVQSNIYERSSFLYPFLYPQLISNATAPLPSLVQSEFEKIVDPYSILNFDPSDLQSELRRTYLPFIQLFDSTFSSEHDSYITSDPRKRSLLTITSNENSTIDDDDEFYHLISSFYDVRTKVDHLTNEYDVLQRKIASLLPHVWSFSSEKAESGSYCGDSVYLKRSVLFEQANFDRNLANEVDDTLKQLRSIIYKQYVALKYETLWYKMKIDQYIANIISNRSKLLHAIEILFNFQRYRTRDNYFYTYTRQVLKRTVSAVYSNGTYNETLFIINHVLRCPPGISQWAIEFVKFLLPSSLTVLYSDTYTKYCAHFLATILFPIKNRERFLQNWIGENGERCPTTPINPNTKNDWLLIDADGHERTAILRWDTLNEDDLIGLLQQFDLNYLMKLLFNITNNQDDHNQIDNMYEHAIKTLALLDLFAEILCQGFSTYSDSQYKMFHKHIGKLVRDCVHACRYHVDCVSKCLSTEENEKLWKHYYAYIYRSVESIISKARNVRWNLLSLFALFDLPSPVRTRLLHIICSISDNEIITFEGNSSLDQMLNVSTPSEILSLLKVLHNLGQPGDDDGQFTNVIFNICFIHPISREYSLRDGRAILVHFSTIEPTLISHFVTLAASSITTVGKVLIGVFRELPIHLWKPNRDDLEQIEKWLMDIESTVSFQLAIHLIDSINWNFSLDTPSELFVPYFVHCKVAFILLQLHMKYCDKITATKEHQQQINAYEKIKRSTSNKNSKTQNLDEWIWFELLRLRLNRSCLSIEKFVNSANKEDTHGDFNDESLIGENLAELQRAANQNHSLLAIYMLFGLDVPGNSAAGFFELGIAYLSQLIQNGKYLASIRILHDMSGILVRSVQYLIENVEFMTSLKTLLNASDNPPSFLKTATSYLHTQQQTEGSLTSKLLASALLDLLIWLEDSPKYRRLVLLLWFKLLTALKEWNKDNSILYVLDQILSHSFVHDVMNKEVVDHLFELAVSALSPNQHNQSRAGFFSWLPLPSTDATQIYWSLLSIDSSLLSRYPVVSYFFLNAEYSFELDENVLMNLKKELENNSNGKVESIWKKLIQQRHYPSIPLTSLSLYRWGTMASEMSVKHPLLPIVWENFFTIYLSKHQNGLHHVGYRLFETPTQITFLKQMKRSLCQASEYYASQQHMTYANKLTTFYNSLSLWIDEPRIHDPQLNINSLPPQYDNERLSLLFDSEGKRMELKWMELVDIRHLYENLEQLASTNWSHLYPRTTAITINRTSTLNTDQLLTSAEKLIDLVSNVSLNVQQISSSNEPDDQAVLPLLNIPNDKKQIKVLFEKELINVINWLETHCQRHEKQLEFDQLIMTLLPLLWKNEFQEQSIQASCQNALNPVHQCTRPAYIIVRYKSKQQCQNSTQRLESTLSEHKSLLTDACRSCDISICKSIDYMNQIVNYLTKQLSSSTSYDTSMSLSIIEVGTELFYIMLKVYNENYNEYMLPLHEQINSLLDILGEIFVKCNPKQAQTIIEHIVLQRANITRLILYFNPNSVQNDKFIDIYKKLSKLYTIIERMSYLIQLFRKFNITLWFTSVTNTQRLTFITTLFLHMRSLVEDFHLAAKTDHPPLYDEPPLIEQTQQLFDIAIGHMVQILHYNYPTQTGHLFQAIIETMFSLRKKQPVSSTPIEFNQSIELGLLPSKVLYEYLEQLQLLESTATITLGVQQIDDMLNWLIAFVINQTESGGEKRLQRLYELWKPCSFELTRIYSIIFTFSVRKLLFNGQFDLNQIFGRLKSLYSSFINPSGTLVVVVTEWKYIIDNYNTELTHMIKCFIQSCQFLYDCLRNTTASIHNQYFTCLLNYWYEVTKCFILNEQTYVVLELYHHYLKLLPWYNHNPTVECLLMLEQLLSEQDHLPSTVYEFMVHLLSVVDTQTWMANTTNDKTSLIPVYFRLLVNLFLSEQANYPDNNEYLSKLSSQCENINWSYLDFEMYQDVINSLISKIPYNFIIAPRASIEGYLVRILRCSCEFWSSSVTSDHIRSKRLCYIRLIEQCLINGKGQHERDEYRLALINILNDVESLSLQNKLNIHDELEDILIELIRFLNIPSLGQQCLASYHNYLLEWIRHSQKSVMMIPMLKSVCKTIKDINRKVILIETTLYMYFLHDKHGNWMTIIDIFNQNEIKHKTDDYIRCCCEHNALLTLYLYVEYQQMINTKNNDQLQHELELLEKIVDLLTTLKVKIPHGEEERVLLLFWKINQMIIHQLEYGKSTDFFLTRLIKTYSQWLLNLGTDNKEYAYSGLLAIIGIGKKAQYSVKFRLFVKLLGIIQLEQITDEPCKVRIDLNDRRPDITSTNNIQLKQALVNLSLTTTTSAAAVERDYNEYKSELIHCNSEYLSNPHVTYFDITKLILYLFQQLFSDLPYLYSIVTQIAVAHDNN